MPDFTRQQWIEAFLLQLAALRARTMTAQYVKWVAAEQWEAHGSELKPDDAAFLWHTRHSLNE